MISLHIPLGRRLIRTRKFDLRGMKSILDVGSGAGQIAGHLLEFADPRRADHVHRPVAADAVPRPHAAEERSAGVRRRRSYRPAVRRRVVRRRDVRLRAGARARSARRACARLARVMRPGGRMLLLTTEDNFSGAWTSRIWCCRTYNRAGADGAVRVARPALEERAVVHAACTARCARAGFASRLRRCMTLLRDWLERSVSSAISGGQFQRSGVSERSAAADVQSPCCRRGMCPRRSARRASWAK